MKIIVCIKQVPNTNEVKIDPKTGTLIREGVPSIINPDDKNALEAALTIKEEKGAQVIVLTMGPPQAEFALREALAMGADEAILLSDRAFAGADTWATSLTLAYAMKKIGDYSLIFCGHQAIDGDTAQVGPELAEHLNLPQITFVQKIMELATDKIVVERKMEDGYEIVEASLPVVVTTVRELNVPRYPKAAAVVDAFDKKSVTVWNAQYLEADSEQIGLKGSPTQVKRTFSPTAKGAGKMLSAVPKEAVETLVAELRAKSVI